MVYNNESCGDNSAAMDTAIRVEKAENTLWVKFQCTKLNLDVSKLSCQDISLPEPAAASKGVPASKGVEKAL